MNRSRPEKTAGWCRRLSRECRALPPLGVARGVLEDAVEWPTVGENANVRPVDVLNERGV
jgi:hypothetical protein